MFNIQMLYVNRAEGCDAINTLYISVNNSYGQDKTDSKFTSVGSKKEFSKTIHRSVSKHTVPVYDTCISR